MVRVFEQFERELEQRAFNACLRAAVMIMEGRSEEEVKEETGLSEEQIKALKEVLKK